jgi:hypothetical protein
MNISGKATIFVREVGKDDNKAKIFETTFSHKDKDGKYVDNVTVRVDFSKELLPDNAKKAFKPGWCYPIVIDSGFISTRGYDNKEGKRKKEISLYIVKCSCDWANAKEIKAKEAEPVKEALVGPDGEPLPF